MAGRRRDGSDDFMALADGREDGSVDAGERQQPVVVEAVDECHKPDSVPNRLDPTLFVMFR
jgi:hypothetical protein